MGVSMEQRYLKIGLAFAVGLLALAWCLNNLLNWGMAHGAVAYTLSQADQQGYEVHLVPPIEHPLAATLVLAAIVAGEGAAGALALLGAWRMWAARRLEAGAFAAAKRPAILGAGIAVLVWFLLFQVIGGALILMGQSEGARGALEGAFRFATYSFLTLIYLSLPEPEPGAG
jgi:predicted small integral membrane protein